MTDPDRYFGYGAEAWDAMVKAGHGYLTELASRGQDTDYTSLCRELHTRSGTTIEPHDFALPYILGEIGTRTFEERGVVVTVLVHYKGGSELGPGFFALCQQCGLLPAGAVGADTKLAFYAKHARSVFDAYEPQRRPHTRE